MRPVSELLTALRTSFWFVPVLMATVSAVLARLAISWDVVVPLWRDAGGQAESRVLLSTLAGSLITVTGVVFSLTVVTLHLASNQYGSRLLRSFMRDRATQVALGIFVSTFVFCIVSLVGRPAPNSVAVGLALLLTGASVVVLIFFIHHLAVSIQAESIVGAVADQLEDQIVRVYPHVIGDKAEPHLPKDRPTVVRSFTDGYVVSIHRASLLRAAAQAGTDIEVLVREGHYIVHGDPLLRAWTDGRIPQAALDAFALGPRRTEAGDVEFSIQQIAQMAARALSPGINDPYTAIACVDRLTSAYCQLSDLDDGPFVEETEGAAVVVPRATFTELLDAGIGAIRQHARTPLMEERLVQALGRVAVSIKDPERKRAVRRQLEAVMEAARKREHPDMDREVLQQRFQEAMERLDLIAAPVDLHRR